MLEHNELRLRLKRLLIQEPMSYRQLYTNIGINYRTFRDFMHNNRATTVSALSKIEKYLGGRERDEFTSGT
jgi:hypothetical protein